MFGSPFFISTQVSRVFNFFGVKGVREVKVVKAKCHASVRVLAFNS